MWHSRVGLGVSDAENGDPAEIARRCRVGVVSALLRITRIVLGIRIVEDCRCRDIVCE